jgi:hypothetical protein
MGFAMCEDAVAFARSFNASDERTLSNGRYVASPLSERRNVRATDNPRFDHRTASVTCYGGVLLHDRAYRYEDK